MKMRTRKISDEKDNDAWKAHPTSRMREQVTEATLVDNDFKSFVQ